jgi:hypothetical protein
MWVAIWTAELDISHAQVSATLSGIVADSSGAVVPGATVTVTNVATGISASSNSDESGKYDFLSLPPGKYNLLVQKEGFQSAAISGVELVVFQKAEVNIRMVLGELKTTVEVVGGAPIVETGTAHVGTVIGELQTTKLPLNLRRYGALAILIPGTTPDNGGTAATPLASPFSETTYNSNGARSSSNNYLVDGTDSRNLGQGGFALQPPPDAVQEFKIQTNVYSAVFGLTPGSTINLVTKSGSNDLHGTVYEFLRNDALDARNYFAADVSKLNRNQFGFALGGPILKNRTFWFVNYEGLREVKAIPGLSLTVPDAAQRSGDFSRYLTGNTLNLCGVGGPANLDFDTGQLFNPGTLSSFTCPTGSAKAGSSILVGSPIPGNIITNIDPVAQKVLAEYPQPNQSGARNYLNTTPQTRNDDQLLVRIDHAFGPKDQLNGRYIFGNSNIIMPFDYSRIAEFGRKMHFRGQNVGLTWSHTFSPTLLNEARFGFQRNWAERAGKNVPREPGFMKSFGIENFEAIAPDFESHPFMNISGFGSVGDANYRPATYPDMLEKYQDNLTWIKGKHTIVAGADMLFYQSLRIMVPFAVNGGINYDGRYSSLADQIPDVGAVKGLADLMMGYPSSGSRTQRFQPNNWVGGGFWNFYVQDDIKVSSRLALNVGLRYEYRRPAVDKRNSLVTFVPTDAPFSGPGNVTLVTAADDAQNDAYCTDPFYSYLTTPDGRCLVASSALRSQLGFTGRTRRSLVHTYKNNWAPRFGLAWRPFDSNKVVIRGGYGIFYDLLPTENMLFVNNNPITTPTQNYSTSFGTPPPGKVQQMFAGAGGIAPIGEQFASLYVSPEYRTPYLQSWSFGIASQLADNWALDLDYIGNKGSNYGLLHLFGNQPYPGVGDLQPRRPYPDLNITLYTSTDGTSQYNSFQAKLTKRTSSGLTFLTSYTLQKGINDGDGNEGFGGGGGQLAAQDDNNPWADRGRSYSDARHRFVASYVWDLPFGQGRRFLNQKGVINQILGGWQISGITSFQSGFPITVFSASDYSNTGTLSPRPDRICSGEGNKTLESWFDTSCFVTTNLADALASGNPRFGNSGRGLFDGPGSIGWDLALLKEFRFTERFRLEFRAEAYSVLNHMNPGFPVTTIGDPLAGQIFDGSGQRNLQFGLKLAF